MELILNVPNFVIIDLECIKYWWKYCGRHHILIKIKFKGIKFIVGYVNFDGNTVNRIRHRIRRKKNSKKIANAILCRIKK